MAVLASYGVAGSGAASAGSITGSSFEIDTDANMVVDGSGIDWLNGGSGSALRSGVHVRDDLPTGQDDDSFTQGTAEDDTPTTITTGSIPNNKSDLTHFGIYVEKYSAATFVNVFWTRVQDPTGTTNMDFEFNQSAVRQNAVSQNSGLSTHTIPLRTPGDILITYDLSKGGTHPVLSRRTWLASGQWGPATVFDDTQALGSINSSAIADAASGGLGALGARTFGEASINLAALVPASQSCTTYGSVFVKSRASDSFTAELKDFIAPEPVTISNCGSVSIHKTDAHGALSGAGFSLYKDVAPTGGTSAGVEDTIVANRVGTCTTDSSGDCTIVNVPKGSYWLVETSVPAGHDAAPDTYVTISAGDQVVPVNLVDPIQHGTITVVKDAVPNDPQDFTFSLDGDPFSLDDDPSDATLPNSRSFTVEVGTHSLSETSIPTGWDNTGLVCNDPTHDTTTDKPSATVVVANGETVTCTYTDTFLALGPDLQTTASAAVADTSWDDTATLTGDGVHPVTGSVAFYACEGQSSAAGCAVGAKVGTDVTVTHASGATYTATTSTPFVPAAAGYGCFRAVFTSSSAYYANDAHTNATTECFLKHNAALAVSKTATPHYGRVYSWTITKDVDKTSVSIPAGGDATFHYTVSVANTHQDNTWSVDGVITVTNPNDAAFAGVDVTDAIDNGAGDCAVTGGTGVTVPAHDSVQLPYVCTYTTAPTTATGVNTATATWDAATYFTTAGTASGTANVDFSAQSPTTTDEAVTVTDTMGGTLGTVHAATDANPRVFTYDVTKSGVAGTCTPYDNTATYTTNDTETSDSASKSVQVCVGSNLATSVVTADGTFVRTDAWTLGKTGTPALITNPNGGTGTYSYTVTVTPAGQADSDFSLGGSVSVTNPNDWEDITADVAVTTDLGSGVTCTVADGTGVTVLRGTTSAPLDFTCAITGTPAETGTVTATVTWNGTDASTPASTTSADQPVTLAMTQELNKVITVVDDKTDPANPVTLGTWDYADGPHDFTYSLTQSGRDSVCTDYVNTASIVETKQTADQTVTLCHTFSGGGGTPVVNPPTVTPPQGGGLPFTGDALGLLARTAAALLAAGLVLLLVSRKRRSA